MAKKLINTEIVINIGLNENNIPEKINWEIPDNPEQEGKQECKAMLLSLFDKKTKDTLKFDIWTNEMQVFEMDRFFFQTLRSLADTYYNATHNKKLAEEMQQFVQHFGKETKIIQEKS